MKKVIPLLASLFAFSVLTGCKKPDLETISASEKSQENVTFSHIDGETYTVNFYGENVIVDMGATPMAIFNQYKSDGYPQLAEKDRKSGVNCIEVGSGQTVIDIAEDLSIAYGFHVRAGDILVRNGMTGEDAKVIQPGTVLMLPVEMFARDALSWELKRNPSLKAQQAEGFNIN